MSVPIVGFGRWGIVLSLSGLVVLGSVVVSASDGPGRVISVSQKVQKKKPAAAAKKGDDAMSKDEMGMSPAANKGAAPASTPANADGMLSFKQDIAPILVANCLGCHSGTGRGITLGKLDMTTFDKLMAGGKRGKDIVGGDPDSSTLVRMIKGEETPKMPPNNGQRGFADEAAEKIETWVKQGAKLDAGVSATDPITKYAATLDDLRRAELSRMSTDDRDKLVEQAGLERWKKATKVAPEVTSTKGGHYLLLSNLPKERATKLLQTMELQFTQVNKLLTTPKGPVLNPSERISLYVFKDTVSFVEFVRTIENQEVDAGEQARAKLSVESPYIVAVDPAAGGDEAAITPAKKGARKKKGEESPGGPERMMAGLLTEQLFAASANKAGKPPRWVALGLGAFMASKLESPSSPYYRRLRAETVENIRIGWQPKANEALGAEGKTETTRAIGFSLFEWMAANAQPIALSSFVRVMLEGQGKLDDALIGCLNLTRQEFLDGSELWLSEHYRRP